MNQLYFLRQRTARQIFL